MKFTVNRSKWICGDPNRFSGSACLLDSDTNRMCCLGFVMKQLGAEDEDIVDIGEPCEANHLSDMFEILVGQGEWGVWSNTTLTERAMTINDDSKIRDTERETKLRDLFAEHGHELEFTGEFNYCPHSKPRFFKPYYSVTGQWNRGIGEPDIDWRYD